jgi:indole-3-glycerol phosphate synthase
MMIEKIVSDVRKSLSTFDISKLEKTYTEQVSMLGEPRSLADAIRARESMSFLLEIKRRSPSKGDLDPNLDAASRAKLYQECGAAAISVLTEKDNFGGSLEDLTAVSCAVSIPVIRKDFIVDRFQLLEARACGADAVLLIVSVLGKNTKNYVAWCRELGLEALVEVHDEHQIETAVYAGAEIIGINNRNLKTLEIDLNNTARLLPKVPPGSIVVSESGLQTRRDIDMMRALGVDAVLIGTALSSSSSVERKLRELVS